MITETKKFEADPFIYRLAAGLRQEYTEEQMEFMSDFRTPLISFSSPGTGKTTAALAGLLTAELHHKIPGRNIYALSFTKAATAELSNRYGKACKKLGVHPTVNFKTLHSLCYKLLKEHHAKLGMPRFDINDGDLKGDTDAIISIAEERGFPVTMRNVRNVREAVSALNSSLTFDGKHIETKYVFRQCGLTLEQFTAVRAILYKTGRLTGSIRLDSTLLYTLELLTKHPDISRGFKDQCKILLVDEFQDMSLLQLRILSLLSENVIAIGDIKQQIYAFNGACGEIVKQYFKYFPNARQVNLTQSFRCKDEIADYATALILPNRTGGEDFNGTGPGGQVKILRNIDIKAVCERIADDFRGNRNTFERDVMFLFRNNYSAIPIAEELYRLKVPMRVSNYTAANKIPVIRGFCELCQLALNPERPDNAAALQYLIPEFKTYKNNVRNHPMYKLSAASGRSLFELNYDFREPKTGNDAMELLMEMSARIRDKGNPPTAEELLIMVWKSYVRNYLAGLAPYLEYSVKYFTRLVQPLLARKTFENFLQDESRKIEAIRASEFAGMGVRCYTFHSAKGTEADDVYILNADRGVVPNDGKLADMSAEFCAVEVAREVRNERSLAYVACTRAKENLYIAYEEELSPLFTQGNAYSEQDEAYAKYADDYADAEEFERFCNA
jgi:DNA helicase-2/ATP-dependent DNA helicase PcrA